MLAGMIKKLLGLIVILVLVAGGVAFYWFYLALDSDQGHLRCRGRGPPRPCRPLTRPRRPASTEPGPCSPRIRRLRAYASTRSSSADWPSTRPSGAHRSSTGPSPSQGPRSPSASFVAHLDDIVFTDSPGGGLDVANRKQALETSGLQLSTYPTGSFKLTEPIDLKSLPKACTVVTLSLPPATSPSTAPRSRSHST